jgi:hypothetical protein
VSRIADTRSWVFIAALIVLGARPLGGQQRDTAIAQAVQPGARVRVQLKLPPLDTLDWFTGDVALGPDRCLRIILDDVALENEVPTYSIGLAEEDRMAVRLGWVWQLEVSLGKDGKPRTFVVRSAADEGTWHPISLPGVRVKEPAGCRETR